MNGVALPRVVARVRGHIALTVLACSVFLITTTGCIEVNGAAAEFSWSLRSSAGEPVARCADASIAQVELRWTSDESDGFDVFDCVANRGVTDFVIRPGRQLLSIVPICNDGMEPDVGTFSVPPPIARTVRNGEVVTLSSLLIVVQNPGCTPECIAECRNDSPSCPESCPVDCPDDLDAPSTCIR